MFFLPLLPPFVLPLDLNFCRSFFLCQQINDLSGSFTYHFCIDSLEFQDHALNTHYVFHFINEWVLILLSFAGSCPLDIPGWMESENRGCFFTVRTTFQKETKPFPTLFLPSPLLSSFFLLSSPSSLLVPPVPEQHWMFWHKPFHFAK